MSGIKDMKPGDIVKDRKGRYHEVKSVFGVDGNRLAKPSDGGFGVNTIDGGVVDMWGAAGYFKKDELPEGVQVEPRGYRW
jgi:hypothetical protein